MAARQVCQQAWLCVATDNAHNRINHIYNVVVTVERQKRDFVRLFLLFCVCELREEQLVVAAVIDS